MFVYTKKLILVFSLLSVFFYSTVCYSDYEEIKKSGEKTNDIKNDINYWNNEANIVVNKIDALLARYSSLKAEGEKEISDYRNRVVNAIKSEKQRKLIVQKDCNEKGIKCEFIKIHDENISKMNIKLNLLESIKLEEDIK